MRETPSRRGAAPRRPRAGPGRRERTFVRQEAVRQVAVAELSSGQQRLVPYPHPVVQLVARLEPPQDADGVLRAGLSHVDLLEAPLERLFGKHDPLC